MDGEEAKKIIDQIRNIILSRPNKENIDMNDSKEWVEVQEAIKYLSDCVQEMNVFIKHISAGELDVIPPSRNNFMAGELKGLQANLRHMTWQADRVAKGDYSQRVRFLGEFSESFNEMVSQINKREYELKQQAEELLQTTEVLELIMDGLHEWIVVTTFSNREILYVNGAARNIFCQNENESDCNEDNYSYAKDILEQIQKYDITKDEPLIIDCEKINRIFRCRFCKVNWNGERAIAHIISDITNEKEEKAELERMAFKDELTGMHNRRYFMKELKKLINSNIPFSLCSIDLNRLKYANDTFGHIAGDEYIKTVAKVIFDSVRSYVDIVCRIGGDEFIVILCNCPEEIAIRKMNEIADIIKSTDREYPMGISFGVCYVEPNTKLSIEDIIYIADKRMYEFKKNTKIHNN